MLLPAYAARLLAFRRPGATNPRVLCLWGACAVELPRYTSLDVMTERMLYAMASTQGSIDADEEQS